MTAAGLSPLVLPRSAALTDLLLGARSDDGPDPDDVATVCRRLEAGLRRPVGRRTGRVRVTGYLVRRAHGSADAFAGRPPFRWSVVTARRTLGIAAVRSCVTGSARSPAEATATVVRALASDGRQGLGRDGSLAQWLGRLAEPARAIVQAEATSWATALWASIEWGRLGDAARVGLPDRYWSPTGAADVCLQGRADVRLEGTGAPGAFLTMLAGRPGPASRLELGLGALVAALSSGGRSPAAPGSVPARVAGWWPDCGRALVLAVDRTLLQETADAVLRTVHRPCGPAADQRATDRDAPADR